jgi:hypothetical protein
MNMERVGDFSLTSCGVGRCLKGLKNFGQTKAYQMNHVVQLMLSAARTRRGRQISGSTSGSLGWATR